MSTTLGKRKRRDVVAPARKKKDPVKDTQALADAQEALRRHFESQFKPLPVIAQPTPAIEDEDVDTEDSAWEGISEPEESGVQVVEHTDAQIRMAAMSKEELKSFMVLFLTSVQLPPL